MPQLMVAMLPKFNMLIMSWLETMYNATYKKTTYVFRYEAITLYRLMFTQLQ